MSGQRLDYEPATVHRSRGRHPAVGLTPGRLGFAAFLVSAVVVIVYALTGNPLDPFDRRWFGVADWAAADETGRARMARDLVRHDLPIGMTRGQVGALLGVAPETNGRSEYLYPIDPCGYDRWDTAFVFIRFDSADRLSAASISGY